MRKVAWLILLVPFLLAACHHGRMSEVRGSGNRVLQNRNIGPFTSIETEGAFTIEVTCQKALRLEVEGDDNILPLVTAEISNNVLRLKNTQSYSVNRPVTFRIYVPNLEGLSVSGAGKIDIKEMKNDKFDIDASGAPYITVAGNTGVVNIESSGAGTIDTNKLRAARGVVESNGTSVIDLSVSDELDVKVSGPSTVTYRGDPVVNKNINGPGRVERRSSEGA